MFLFISFISYFIYPPENKHDSGNSAFLIGDTSTHSWLFFSSESFQFLRVFLGGNTEDFFEAQPPLTLQAIGFFCQDTSGKVKNDMVDEVRIGPFFGGLGATARSDR